MKTLTIGLVQQTCSDNRSDTLEKTIAAIRRCAKQGAQLVALQELHTSLYFCDTEEPARFDLAETIPGPSTDTFSALAKELSIVIVTSLFEKRAPGLFHNTAVVLDSDGSIAGKYRKMHIPDDPGYYEKFYFTPGDLGFNPIQTSLGKLGLLVCWDQWYPEAARLMTLAGADLLIYPTAIGWDPADTPDEQERQREAWITIQRSHAIANGIPLLSINRTGTEPGGAQFWGSSFVAGCQGELLAQAPIHQETELIVQLNPARSENVRRIWPFLRDRRIDAYTNLTRRFID
jgi:N-carbamoylputrescine amidase